MSPKYGQSEGVIWRASDAILDSTTGEGNDLCCPQFSIFVDSQENFEVKLLQKSGLESPYVCEYCGYTTGSKPALIGHIRIHTGEKPYICDVCGYRTRTSSRMNGHVRIHTNKRSYRCGQCTYRANRRDSLVRHYLTHTGDKPYHCTQCDYKSTQNSTLKRHVFLVHEKPKRVQEKGNGEP
ncbi:zinc finger protein 879-like [Branchiostoma floridae]|uniref:Zinc finger protein 879-like n=1 Tax=Branchiostoma floridae TaxID=7739 RepID=A0A9J7KLJ5_BRAFL|nr:zinc finger protein 879-like [Branchiostoma floridae]